MRMHLPIACSLEGEAFEARTNDWQQVMAGLTVRTPMPGGVELRYSNGDLREHLQDLVDRETECCPWMSMRLTDHDGGLSLSISSLDPMGEREIHEWFGKA